MGSDGLFVDPIFRFVWKKKSFEKGPKMPFPKETKIFGLTLADIRGKGKPEIISFDSFERVNILSEDGKILYRTRDRFGGTANYYDTLKKKEEAFRPQDSPPWRVYIPGRIVIKDLEGDGIPKIIVNKNEFTTGRLFHRVRSFEKGEIQNLIWEEGALETNWKTREIKGYISDFQVKDADNDGEEELVVAVIPPTEETGALSKQTRSHILFFKLF
jgi:hypothetical protein